MVAHFGAQSALSLLDNPIWHALSTTHTSFAEGDDWAKRYPPAVTPLAGIAELSESAFHSLRQIVRPDDTVGMFLNEEYGTPEGWAAIRKGPLTQMVWTGGELNGQMEYEELSADDIDEMLTLVELTRPGPFGRRTAEFGSYIGIRREGRLVAMAGQRLRLPGFTEISAVCTHPEHRGKGYAASLISALIRRIEDRGETPFLHAASENVGAIRVYEKLGFRTNRILNLMVLKRTVP
ncbi:MAG TPA: GNAT family N-acetyltransferase [Candidatus Angelobacter sp.]|nr:GNAT family N-acetyltransferase [Candidatus Angelobacter sp.]